MSLQSSVMHERELILSVCERAYIYIIQRTLSIYKNLQVIIEYQNSRVSDDPNITLEKSRTQYIE